MPEGQLDQLDLQADGHIVVACCEEHRNHEKTVVAGPGREVAACADELEGAENAIGGDERVRGNQCDAEKAAVGRFRSGYRFLRLDLGMIVD